MTAIAVLVGATAFAFACKRPIKACPMAFYALAVALDVLFVVGSFTGLPSWSVRRAPFCAAGKLHVSRNAVRRRHTSGCSRAFARGVVPAPSAELSIMAWLLSLGNCKHHLSSYATSLSSGLPQANVAVALVVALALFALLIVLGVTSFNFVKKRMKETWKRVQLLAYPFWGLVYVHLLLMLLPSALRGGAPAQMSVVVYSVVFLGYAVLRIRRALVDQRPVPRQTTAWATARAAV